MTLALKSASVLRGGRAILDNADVELKPGRFAALCGPNGAGKTTALSVMAGSLKPDAGSAELDGVALRSIRGDRLARRRAVVSQSPLLSFPFEVHEVVAMGRTPHHGISTPEHDQSVLAAVLERVDLLDLAERNYMTLSGGERQRVHIARALAQIWDRPTDDADRWLLLDEPTSALDLKHQISLMLLLRELAAGGWGVAAVLHDLHLVRAHADDVVLFKSGRVAGAGVSENVLTPTAIQSVFELDAPYLIEGQEG